nr:transposase [Evansella tamaricis]
MLRGTNRQEIFHDEEDNRKFLEIMLRYKQRTGILVYGWCLMSNHVHLLVREGDEEIGTTIKRIGVSFAFYYNWKYYTSGHVFQDRFKSEKVETEKYLLTVIRYLHQNPVKAGVVKRPPDWKWSSCRGYYGMYCYPVELLDDSFVLNLFPKDSRVARERFMEFNERQNQDQCLDDTASIRISDEEARDRIREVLGELEIAQVKSLPKVKRDEVLRKVKDIEGVSQRQAARILGVSPTFIFKA